VKGGLKNKDLLALEKAFKSLPDDLQETMSDTLA